ncbi:MULTISPECIES: adenylate/guanylate cyclase domain-containing protein [Bradyrhizobium]|uniref:Adenylate/guanylate cyclase domain-containing protein n=1 Tax=Bradyrhizobium brasilense TaxID=1419277 RepID=A0ABY8J9J8_9BRAD|nr:MULTISPECIES: adenylate/guanylate cyclase domain-containing protein [Bradyrhizobium]MCP1833240.1 adenylate cyclase [Bradyrhizobium sp. USDA 4545]MCP1917984.1 adenylate cyclase [Bradyrhizobium sp. USDA 4532]WFU60477.1 adenylate/guanylate cyclase domain-containing protein [Bradyrhizobium brasilense]
MTDHRVERRLAAILAADVAGYSRLTGLDEEGTHVRLRECLRGLADPKISEHRGKVVKHTGDGMLAEFGSVVDAVRCAIEVQRGMAERNATVPQLKRIEFRIGIHVGDIIVDENDIFGDGVNIAARLEGIAEPGGICISDDAQRQIRGKVDAVFEDMGSQNLKNIAEPMRAWRLRINAGHPASAPTEPPVDSAQALALPDKPSIAVLPFENMSGDPEQEYFADGMVEEIITALSRFKWLFVIARNSSFTFKGRAVDIKEVGRRLGVRYVLEGSVRKAAGKVRITGQLIDAVTGTHIWADRFERDLTDIFALQDEVTVAVVSAIQPKLLQIEIGLSARRPENLTAYDFYLRAMQQHYLMTADGLAEAIRLAHRALELDPRFGFVAALAGLAHMQNILWGHAVDPQFDRKEAVRLLRLALSIDDGDAETLAWVSLTSAYMVGDCESEIELADRVVALNPNSYRAWTARGSVYRVAGLPDEAVRSFERAIRLSPLDPRLPITFVGMGMAFIELRRFDEAIAAANKCRRQNASYSLAYRCLASAFAHLGRDAEAREAAALLLQLDPAFTISAMIARGGYPNAQLLIEGLRRAGLPE